MHRAHDLRPGIRDTVISLKPRQYGSEGIVRYDLLAVTADADFSQGEDELRATGAIDTMLEARAIRSPPSLAA